MKRALALAFILTAIAAPARAEGSWLQFFFPSLRSSEPDVSKTLAAPWEPARPADVAGPPPAAAVEGDLPENHVALDLPHRTAKQVGDYAVMAVSEGMTYDRDDNDKTYAANLTHFDDEGRKEYIDFLQQSGIIAALHDKKYYLRAVAQENPLLLNEGALEGRYRWLFEIPVMLSYADRAQKSYKNAPPPVNQYYTITVQVGRTGNEAQGRDLTVERWSAKMRRPPEPPKANAPPP